MKNRIITACLTAFALLTAATIYPTAPTSARTVNTDLWTGEVGPRAGDTALVRSNILRTGGQRVILDMRDGSFTIPISLEADEDTSGTLSVNVTDRDWLTVLPSETELSLTKGTTENVELTVTMIKDSSAPSSVTTGPEDSGGENETSPPEETTDPEETTAFEGEGLEDDGGMSGGVSGEGAAGFEEDDFFDDEPETTEEPETTAEPIDLTPSRLSFEVAFESETISMTATFEMIDEETRRSEFPESGIHNGIFTDPLGWYSLKYPMLLTLDNSARLKISAADEDEPAAFPPGTAYEFDGSGTLLYDGGYIDLPSGGNLIIDLSNTDLGGTLKLYTDSSNCEMREIDAISEEGGGAAVVAVGDETSIGLPYSWGGTTPEFSAERLIVQQDKSVIWNIASDITVGADADGRISLNTANAPAGTYKINFSWTVNDNTLYSTEMIVFVRHVSGGQGGHSR